MWTFFNNIIYLLGISTKEQLFNPASERFSYLKAHYAEKQAEKCEKK